MRELLYLFGGASLLCVLCDIFSAENRECGDSWERFMDEQDKKKAAEDGKYE